MRMRSKIPGRPQKFSARRPLSWIPSWWRPARNTWADKYQADAARWGYIDPARWNAFYGWLNENQLLVTQIPENAGFSNDYLPQ